LDQRGCGRSTPLVTAPDYDLRRNTTPRLIDDIERLRTHLQVDRWLANGVSWGSTLALAYGQAHPERVLGIVLVAVTTTSRFRSGPDHPNSRGDLPRSLGSTRQQRGTGVRTADDRPDPAVRDAASRAWVDWEDHHISIGTGGVRPRQWGDDEQRHVFATLVTHYWAHDAFLTQPILDQMSRLHGLPATLIHGRLDGSGPAIVPWRLHRAWPESELLIHETDGHGGAAMVEAWCAANSQHAARMDAMRT